MFFPIYSIHIRSVFMLSPNYLLAGDFLKFESIFLERFPERKTFAANEIIIDLPDDRSKVCYYVLHGTAVYTLLHENGGAKLSTMRGVGTIFPLYYTYQATTMERNLEVTALTTMETIVIPKEELHKLMLEIPEIAIAMIDTYGKYATILLYDNASQFFDSVKTKVSSFIYLQCYGNNANLPSFNMTHEQISKATGVSRANVSRTISELRRDGIISTEHNCIYVQDKDALMEYCSYMASLGST